LKKLCKEERSILLEAGQHGEGSLDLLPCGLWSGRFMVKYGETLWIFKFLPRLRALRLIDYSTLHWTFTITPKGKRTITPHPLNVIPLGR